MISRSLTSSLARREPPNRSRADRRREISAKAIAAECEAERDFDTNRGVPLSTFIH
jgi:hypothetical protein